MDYYNESNARRGVYLIINKQTGEFYIGSVSGLEKTTTFTARKNAHSSGFRNNRYITAYLQNSWNKWGENNFTFIVIKPMDNHTPQEIIDAEQWFIDNWEPKFNMSETAGFVTRTKDGTERCSLKMSMDWSITSPDGEKFIVHGLRKFCREKGLSYRHMHNVAVGKAGQYKGWKVTYLDGVERFKSKAKEARIKGGKVKRDLYLIGFPDGHSEVIKGITSWCKQMGFPAITFSRALRWNRAIVCGKAKGFSIKKLDKSDKYKNFGLVYSSNKENPRGKNIFEVTYPDSETKVVVNNMKDFERFHDLSGLFTGKAQGFTARKLN